jgi:hypothetical protein
MNTLIIVNNAASKAQNAWPMIEEQLTAAGVGYDIYHTTAPGDATQKTRSALKSGTRTVAVVGGDGTLGEAAEGFSNSAVMLTNSRHPLTRKQHSQYCRPEPETILLAVSIAAECHLEIGSRR